MAGLDSYVTGLYSFNNSWEDRSGNGLEFTVGSALSFDATNKKFGTHAMNGGGWAGRQTAAATGQNAFGSGDFTIDLWVRLQDQSQGAMTLAVGDTTSNSYWEFMWVNGGNIRFYAKNTSSAVTANFTTTTAPCTSFGTWYHVAVVRNGTDEYVFVDGVVQSLNVSTGFSASLGIASATPLKVGWDHSDFFGFWGEIDELRISKGIARWTSNFDVPVSEYSEADIAGTLSEEARLLIIDESTWEIEHNAIHSAGPYIIPAGGGGGTKIVTGSPTDPTKAPITYKTVVPAS